MRKYIILSVIATFTILFNSCEEFLMEEPKAKLSPESFYKNVDDLEVAVKGLYDPLYTERGNMPGAHRSFQMHMAGDDLTTHPASNKAQWRAVDRFDVLSTTFLIEKTAWKLPYKVITQANAIIEAKEGIEGDEDEINKFMAVAFFWRGWAHFYSSRFYNDVPIITTTLFDPEQKRDPVLEVYQQVESDLTEALKYLPESWVEDTYPSSWAAKMLLADMYMTWAGWPVKDASKYAMAAQLAKDVMDNSGAELLEDFADLWKYDPYGTYDHHKESIWEIVYATNEEIGTNGRARVLGRNFVPENEKQGWSDFFCEIGFFNRYPESYRKEITFHTEIVVDDTTVIPWTQYTTAHPYYAKYRGNYEYPGTHTVQSGDNFEVYRFADALLMYAEAKAMSDGPDATAYEAVNMVRRRAHKLDIYTPNDSVDLQPGLDAIAFRDSVLDEKAWEFAAEQRRWYDLIRTEKVEWAASTKDENDLAPLKTVGKNNYVFPIPYADVLMNENLVQNPGYE